MLEHVSAQGPIVEPLLEPAPERDDVEDYVRERCGEIDESFERTEAIWRELDAAEEAGK